jgi:hypothetical protein
MLKIIITYHKSNGISAMKKTQIAKKTLQNPQSKSNLEFELP